ncbi:TROVE domain-containing protein [Sandaracinus amylolyticus]|uniref:TROVE domain-containing protein n=1 Tax=Sandaracinus amylolyticus TaxID=927083 RepID=UPI001F255F5E|nr:TROVE domain-containing protein [Sandaracinus amylolyticus]UJR83279.1 Hypothetical protein I5071_53460 [Sandaracinus amylolyticus]
MSSYARHLAPNATPQSERADARQVRNSAGGFTFALDDFARLERFLILGNEGGSYYATERALTIENAGALVRCLGVDGARTVDTIVAISESGRAPENDPAIFALALAASHAVPSVRARALAAMPRVCRTGTHLFHFVREVQALRGWGRALRKAIASWYLAKAPDELAYQLAKYTQRDGVSHRDVLRLAHPKAKDPATHALLRWAVAGEGALGPREVKRVDATAIYPAVDASAMPRLVEGFARVRAQDLSSRDVAALITEHGLTHEMIPSIYLARPEVWEALLPRMPLHAMLRNLARMTANGLVAPGSAATSRIVARLGDRDAIRKSRVHPMDVLIALRTYASGHGLRGSLAWTPVSTIVDALDAAFDLAFVNVEPTGKTLMLALDVSGSMSMGQLAGSPLTPREAAAAMALVTARTERDYQIMAFSDRFVPLDVTARMRLHDVVEKTSRLPFSATDCAIPMLHATERNLRVDAFCVYTDNETWFGGIHPHQALAAYRAKTGIPAKLVVTGMTATKFTIADPNDPGMLDVVGFDAAAPAILAAFLRN